MNAHQRQLFIRHRHCSPSAMVYGDRASRCEECGMRWVLKRHSETGNPIAYALIPPPATRALAYA